MDMVCSAAFLCSSKMPQWSDQKQNIIISFFIPHYCIGSVRKLSDIAVVVVVFEGQGGICPRRRPHSGPLN